MNAIKAFLAAHKLSTHTIAALFVAGVAAYQEVPAFHAAVLSAYAHLPHVAQTAVTVALALYSWYRNGQKTSGQ